MEVEIDETAISRRKYNRGRVLTSEDSLAVWRDRESGEEILHRSFDL